MVTGKVGLSFRIYTADVSATEAMDTKLRHKFMARPSVHVAVRYEIEIEIDIEIEIEIEIEIDTGCRVLIECCTAATLCIRHYRSKKPCGLQACCPVVGRGRGWSLYLRDYSIKLAY